MGKDSVIVREEGKKDRVLPMSASCGNGYGTAEVIMEDPAGLSQTAFSVVASNTGSCMVEGGTSVSIAAEGTAAIQNTGVRFGACAKYGLSFDEANNTLFYQGKRVRLFDDTYPLDQGAVSMVEHFDELGAIDVEAVRDFSKRNADGSYDPSGALTGLRILSGEAFFCRDLGQWKNPPAQQATVSESGTPMTAKEKKAFYAPFALFGLTYDEALDTLFYQGQPVRRVLDVQKSNGEPFSSGRFQGTMTHLVNDSGVVDVPPFAIMKGPTRKEMARSLG